MNQTLINRKSFLPIFLGGLFGLWFVGFSNVFPWRIGWLVNKTDGTAQQLAWEFYRQTPIFQWPPLAVPNYIRGSGSVDPTGGGFIQFPIKVIGKLIPGDFQYLGVYIVLTFCLQAYFGWRLLGLFITEHKLQVIGSVFFFTAPILVYRIGAGHHFQLGAQWLILAAFVFYFENELGKHNWTLLLLASIFISIYITAMVATIFLSSVVRWLLNKDNRKDRQRIFKSIIYPLLALASGFILMGYYTYGKNSAGTGSFRLNLFSFLNPDFTVGGTFSFFFSTLFKNFDRSFIAYEVEGFAYLGVGILLGLIVFGPMFVKYLRLESIKLKAPLIIACGLLFFFAVSNHPAIMKREYSYWWPDFLITLKAIFRATTRFGWPLYYLTMVGALVASTKVLPRRLLTAAFVMLLVIQLVDIGPSIRKMHRDLSSSYSYVSQLNDPRWKYLAQNYSKIDLYPNFDLQLDESPSNISLWDKSWFSFNQLAVDNQMSINAGLSARPLGEFPHRDNSRIFYELSTGKLDRDTVYVIASEEDWNKFKLKLGSKAFASDVDGFFVLAYQG